MTLEQLIALGIAEDVAKKILEAHQTAIKDQYVPISRFNEVNDSNNTLKKDLKERDKQLKELGEKAKGNEELTKQISDLQEANKSAAEKYESEMKELKLSNALKLALTGQVHDPDIVTKLLDKTKIILDENGSIKSGLDDQVKSLKESKAFLFVEKTKGPEFKGVKPVEGKDKDGNDISVGASFAQAANQTGKTPENSFNPWG